MVKLRLKRMGKKHYPIYKIVVADSRSPRDGRFIEAIGSYNPNIDPMEIKIDEGRAKYWLNVGAQPTDTVRSLFKSEGLIFKMKLEKAGSAPEAIETEMQKFLSDKQASFVRAREKKARRKLSKKKKAETKDAPVTPISAEAPKVEDAPKTVAAPKVEEAPKAEDKPKVEEAPKAEDKPKVEEATKAEDKPKV
ncbi:MAG: 30S ribosomal protein S16, partial [bacterium]|nr:30S ribosomal protein S16 [bacterium]